MKKAKTPPSNIDALLAQLEAEVRRMEHGHISSRFLGDEGKLALRLLHDIIIPAGEPIPIYTDDGRIWEYENEDDGTIPDASAAHGTLVPLLRRAFIVLYQKGQSAFVTSEAMAEAAHYAEQMRRAAANHPSRPSRVCAAEFRAMCECGDQLAACIACSATPAKPACEVTQEQLAAMVKKLGGKLSADTIQRNERGVNTRIPLALRNTENARLTVQAADAWSRSFVAWQLNKLKTRVAFNEGMTEHSKRK